MKLGLLLFGVGQVIGAKFSLKLKKLGVIIKDIKVDEYRNLTVSGDQTNNLSGLQCDSKDTSFLCCLISDQTYKVSNNQNDIFFHNGKKPNCCMNAALNEQIGFQVAAADYMYNMAYSVSTVKQNFPNLAKFLHNRAGKEREIGITFSKFQTERGGIVTLPTKRNYLLGFEQTDGIQEILNSLMNYEKQLTKK